MNNLKTTSSCLTLSEALSNRDEFVWKELEKITLIEASESFVSTLHGNTKRAYKAAFCSIFSVFKNFNIFNPENNLQTLAISNMENLLDEIRTKISGSESTKQARAAAFIALTRYLQRATGGLIKKVVPRKDKGNPTFRQIRETSVTKSLTKEQWMRFLSSLKMMSYRDYLIAKTILQGAKRVGEVTSAQINQINWEKKQIYFKQFKSNVLEKETIITYPEGFIKELFDYVNIRKEGPIFISRKGKPLTQSHLYRSFNKAGILAKIEFSVHPHVLRASAINYLAFQGYHSDQIIKVSGHSNTKLVTYYNKTPIEQNPTQNTNLI